VTKKRFEKNKIHKWCSTMIINRQDDIPDLKKTFFSIFSNYDPFDKMFLSSIASRVLLYPTNSYHLSEQQFSALINTLNMIGEKSFYLSEIEVDPFVIDNLENAVHTPQYLELIVDTTFKAYSEINIIFENALYSINGKWGVIVSHEGHAVLGGDKTLITTFKNLYPYWMEDQKKFVKAIQYWGKRSITDTSWLASFIEYINS
jgi:hypothetical protein